jgi:hypothetical protein
MLSSRSAAAAAFLLLLSGVAGAQTPGPSPYDMTYAVNVPDAAGAPLRRDMALESAIVATLPSDATGIVLRWCRPEIPFGMWQFGAAAEKQALLDERWCEVSWRGTVGSLPGAAIRPE